MCGVYGCGLSVCRRGAEIRCCKQKDEENSYGEWYGAFQIFHTDELSKLSKVLVRVCFVY